MQPENFPAAEDIGEPRGVVVKRRLRTIPPYIIGLAVATVLLPVLLAGAALVDLVRWVVRRRPWMAVRLVAFLWVYLAVEVGGITIAFAQWVAAGGWAGRGRDRMEEWGWWTQAWWSTNLFRGVEKIFGLSFEVEGAEVVRPGPVVVFFRHASIVDNLLPAVLVSAREGVRLRWVIKKELLSDPALDVGGHRIPNYFVDRNSTNSAREIARVRALADGLGPRDGVLVYPEGTRFTEAKQRRALQKLSTGDPEVYARAGKLRNVLPPRLGGPLALLDAGTDVIFCAHTGLGGFAHIADLWNGELIGRRIRVRFWRIPKEQVPEARSERAAWFYDQWQHLDDWIGSQGSTR